MHYNSKRNPCPTCGCRETHSYKSDPKKAVFKRKHLVGKVVFYFASEFSESGLTPEEAQDLVTAASKKVKLDKKGDQTFDHKGHEISVHVHHSEWVDFTIFWCKRSGIYTKTLDHSYCLARGVHK